MYAHGDAGAITTTAVFHDVTALAVAELSLNGGSSAQVLLAGIGSQLHAFDLPSGRPLFTAAAVLPNAARCHGLAVAWMPGLSAAWIAAHGDRHVAVLSLAGGGAAAAPPAPLAALPRLPGWTMAVQIAPLGPQDPAAALVTVGLSNNSVEFHRLSRGGGGGGGGGSSVRLGRVECADRCLLYSMDLFPRLSTNKIPNGSEKGACLVAGGTIFLDVIVWAAAAGDGAAAVAPVLYRLKGHEGSIHTVRWGPGGAALASGSDDRTLRLWAVPEVPEPALFEKSDAVTSSNALETALEPRHVLYGHQARLWAAAFTPDGAFLASASEDGTCRVWDAGSGACLATVKAHRYRGVWHCALRRGALVTAGADGAVKVWSLWDVLAPGDAARVLAACGGGPGPQWEAAALRCALPDPEATGVGAVAVPPKTVSTESGNNGEASSHVTEPPRFDSTAEWVRCLALTGDASTLFVATNRGLLHEVRLPRDSVEERWTTVYKSPRRRPLAALSLAEGGGGRRLGACDITGHAVALIQGGGASAEWWSVEWRPYGDAAAVGVHLLAGLPPALAFTAGPAAALTLWDLGGAGDGVPLEVADAEAEGLGKGALVVSLAAAPVAVTGGAPAGFAPWEGDAASAAQDCRTWLVAAGTGTGGVALWRLHLETAGAGAAGRFAGGSMALLSRIAGVHADTPVRSIALRPGRRGGGLELESGGSNGGGTAFAVGAGGALRALEERRTDAVLVVVGTVGGGAAGPPSHSPPPATARPANPARLIYGFQTTNFVVWDAEAEAQVCAVHCNSWRRPWAAAVAGADAVTFVSEVGAGRLVVHRRRPACGSPSLPRCLLPAGHGSEINAAGVLAVPGGGAAVFTGGEEASVRQAVVGRATGEHAGSISSRSVELVADHVAGTSVKCLALAALPSGGASQPRESLLVTGGAKQALMAWVARPRAPQGCTCELVAATATPAAFLRKNVPKGQAPRAAEVRYLAVDALVPRRWAPGAPQIAFVVAGASSGAVELLALPLDPALRGSAIGQQQESLHWQRVATLRHHSPPVISVTALTLGGCEAAGGRGERFVAFSGGTDGAVAVWDLSGCVFGFLAAAAAAQTASAAAADRAAANPASHTRVAAWEAATVEPVGAITGVHQSGVNGLSAAAVDIAAAGGGAAAEVMVVTAGDDQALTATLLQLTWPLEGTAEPAAAAAAATCRIRGQAKEANAHSSAARDVWTDGTTAFSVGLDQRLRRWAVRRWAAAQGAANGALGAHGSADGVRIEIEETGCVVTQALEPAAVAVAARGGDAGGAAGSAVTVAVAGRGMQVLEWSL